MEITSQNYLLNTPNAKFISRKYEIAPPPLPHPTLNPDLKDHHIKYCLPGFLKYRRFIAAVQIPV